MRLPKVAHLFFFFTCAFISASHASLQCGVRESSTDHKPSNSSKAIYRRVDDNEVFKPFTIWFHVIAKDNTIEGGSIPDSILEDKVRYINDVFKSTGISFILGGIDRTRNARWYKGLLNESNKILTRQVKVSLRRGSNTDLNIFTAGEGNENYLGYSSRPEDFGNASKLDGIVLMDKCFTNPPNPLRNFHMSFVHEIGHWLGLRHTFEGGCDSNAESGGDFVADTPASIQSTVGDCSGARDSCPDLPGLDPDFNFMSNANDGCAREFTPGQIARMRDQISRYRRPS